MWLEKDDTAEQQVDKIPIFSPPPEDHYNMKLFFVSKRVKKEASGEAYRHNIQYTRVFIWKKESFHNKKKFLTWLNESSELNRV